MKFIEQLKELNTGGIILIDNRVYNSSNMLRTVVSLVTSLQQYKVLEVIEDPLLRSIRTAEYTNKGLKGYTKLWKVSIHARPFKRLEHSDMGEYKMFLEASNTYKRVVLGIFDSQMEAEEFRVQYYKNGVKWLVYSSNKNTKEWYEE